MLIDAHGHVPFDHVLSEDRVQNNNTCPIALSVMIEPRTAGYQAHGSGEATRGRIPQTFVSESHPFKIPKKPRGVPSDLFVTFCFGSKRGKSVSLTQTSGETQRH